MINGLYSSLSLIDIAENANEGTDETILATINLPPKSFRRLGDGIEVEAAWAYAANGNVKTIKCYFGTSTSTVNGRAFADNNFYATLWALFIYKGSFIRSISRLTAQDGFTINKINSYTDNINLPIRIRITGQGSASGDVTGRNLRAEYKPVNNLIFG